MLGAELSLGIWVGRGRGVWSEHWGLWSTRNKLNIIILAQMVLKSKRILNKTIILSLSPTNKKYLKKISDVVTLGTFCYRDQSFINAILLSGPAEYWCTVLTKQNVSYISIYFLFI